ncbi:hypothetical protein ACJX0J_005620, partial [Zea mays]
MDQMASKNYQILHIQLLCHNKYEIPSRELGKMKTGEITSWGNLFILVIHYQLIINKLILLNNNSICHVYLYEFRYQDWRYMPDDDKKEGNLTRTKSLVIAVVRC